MTARYKAADEICRLLRTLPPHLNDLFYDDVVAFKKAAREAALAIEAKKPNPAKIEQCLRDLRRWYAA